ncbi:glycosyltransferase [Amycolatopsis benzoatilytica]|uniref:glycosyltransferase n=1 Tax=Amycolatopsis benzoatilytica TaxID=346045 RepID=UPI0003737F7D|nr:glycosyltransferase [Amycolatopsis benzoatilytica]
MIAQRGLFAGPDPAVSRELYAQISSGEARRDRTALAVEPASKVTGNTYFGRFPASYWQRWTAATAVRVEMTVSGDGLISLLASDFEGEPRVAAAQPVSGLRAAVVSLAAPLDRFFDGGALWLDCETGPGQQLVVEDVRWTVAAPQRRRPVDLTICTMNRPADCVATLASLAGDEAALTLVRAVHVVDQGTETVRAHEGFPAVAKALRGRLRYLTQPNLGGAGGFTRGMYESTGDRSGEPADLMFMDDDILLEPDLLVRMTAFSASAAEPLILGGQMLNLLHPTSLHAAAEHTDLDRIRPGRPARHSLHAVDLLATDPATGRPYRQELRVDAGYTGWWACLIPHEVVTETGYPLAVFFQGDDAEYSYRARAHGFPTVTLPGAGVWHTDFRWKDHDEVNRYFIVRNYTIIAALHGRFPVLRITGILLAELVADLLGMQYGAAATLIQAVEDFLAGPEILQDGGVSALRRITELRAGYPETVTLPATAVPGIRSNDIVISEPSFADRLALGPLLGMHRLAAGAVPVGEASWWRVGALRTAVVTDASQRGVRVRTYHRAHLLRLARRGARVLARFAGSASEVRDRYRAALPQLSSRAEWTRLFDENPSVED